MTIDEVVARKHREVMDQLVWSIFQKLMTNTPRFDSETIGDGTATVSPKDRDTADHTGTYRRTPRKVGATPTRGHPSDDPWERSMPGPCNGGDWD